VQHDHSCVLLFTPPSPLASRPMAVESRRRSGGERQCRARRVGSLSRGGDLRAGYRVPLPFARPSSLLSPFVCCFAACFFFLLRVRSFLFFWFWLDSYRAKASTKDVKNHKKKAKASTKDVKNSQKKSKSVNKRREKPLRNSQENSCSKTPYSLRVLFSLSLAFDQRFTKSKQANFLFEDLVSVFFVA